jgi:hypothetical protein
MSKNCLPIHLLIKKYVVFNVQRYLLILHVTTIYDCYIITILIFFIFASSSFEGLLIVIHNARLVL